VKTEAKAEREQSWEGDLPPVSSLIAMYLAFLRAKFSIFENFEINFGLA
jgi:hypothetical protein